MDILTDREKLMKLIWLGFISSLVFIGIGLYLIVADIFG